MSRRILTLVVMAWLSTLNGFTEEVEVLIKGISDGIKTTKQQDYAKALMNAKLQAIERAGIEVSSITRIENFTLKSDTVESKAKAVILPGFQVMDMGYQQDGTYQVVLSGKVRVGTTQIKLAVGDETPLAKVFANPRDYLNKLFIVVGFLLQRNSYYWGYEGYADNYNSLLFVQKSAYTPGVTALSRGNVVYADKHMAGPLIEAIGKSELDKGDTLKVRLKVTITSRGFQDGEFHDQLELVDWQLRNEENTGWGDWAISDKAK